MEATPLSAFKITGTRIDGFVGEGITEVVIPDGIMEIGNGAFRYTEHPAAVNLKSVIIPDSVTVIDDCAFLMAKELKFIRLPSNLKTLRFDVLADCKSLTSLSLPDKLKSIGQAALAHTGLKKLVVPAGVTYIGRGAFYGCHSLESITIPESVQTIEQQAFEGCEKLTIRTTSDSWAKSYAWLHNIPVTLITKKEMVQELLEAQVSYEKLNVFGNDDFSSEVLRRVDELTKQNTQEKPKKKVSFFDQFRFRNKKQDIPSPEDIDKYRELIRFISFAQKIAPLADGNYGITITHEPEKSNRLFATFGFYDFKEITFAREYAIKNPHLKMAEHYYKYISKRAELSQDEWPYGIDAGDFADVLRGEFCNENFTLIPDEHDDDINTLKIVGGYDGRNAIQSHKTIIGILKSRFPELKITQHFAYAFSMLIHVEL